MIVRDLIKVLNSIADQSAEVEAFGPDFSGKFSLRPVIDAQVMTRQTMARGNEGPIVFILTAVYDR